MLCWGIFILLVITSVTTGIYQYWTGKRKRMPTDFRSRCATTRVADEVLACPNCDYSLRNLPDNENGQLHCPECGAAYDRSVLSRPCWIGPRHKIPRHHLVTCGPIIVLALVLWWIVAGLFAIDAQNWQQLAAWTAGVTLVALIAAALFHAGCVNWFGSTSEATKMQSLAMGLVLLQLLTIVSIFVGIGLFVTSYWAWTEKQGAEARWIFTALTLLDIIIGCASAYAAKRLQNHLGQRMLEHYVRRIDEGQQPFPGLDLYWVLDGDIGIHDAPAAAAHTTDDSATVKTETN